MNGSVRRNLTQARLRTNGTARIITLPPHMADQLTAHRERQAATQLPHPDDLVFTTVTGSRPTNYGVESTARDAYERNYGLVFVEDAMSARSAEDHAFAMTRVFPRIGRVTSTSDVLTALAHSAAAD